MKKDFRNLELPAAFWDENWNLEAERRFWAAYWQRCATCKPETKLYCKPHYPRECAPYMYEERYCYPGW